MKSMWHALARAWLQRAWHNCPVKPRGRYALASRIEYLAERTLPAVYTIPVTADGTIFDLDGNGTFDGANTTGPDIITHISLGPVESQEQGVYEFDIRSIPTDEQITSVVLRLTFTDYSQFPSVDYSRIQFRAGPGDGVVNLGDLSNATDIRLLTIPAEYSVAGQAIYDIALSPLYFQAQLGSTQFVSILSQMLSIDGQLIANSLEGGQASDDEAKLIVTTGPTGFPTDTVLTVTRNSTSISESDGPNAMTITVSRSGGDLTRPLDVLLASNDPSSVSVPSRVTIPANTSSIVVPVTAIDNTLLDGPRQVRFVAYADQGTFVSGHMSTDPNFGGDNGIWVPGLQSLTRPLTDYRTTEMYHKLLVQPDGKILTLVSRTLVAPAAGGEASMLTRMNPDGTYDSTFGVNGVVNLSKPNVFFTTTTGMCLQTDGKIVVVGNFQGADWTLVRFNSDGSLDKSWGEFGVVHDINRFRNGAEEETARDVVQLPNGDLFVAGLRSEPIILPPRADAPGDPVHAFQIYSPNGTPRFVPDRSTINVNSAVNAPRLEYVNGVVLDSQGTVLIASSGEKNTSAQLVTFRVTPTPLRGLRPYLFPGVALAVESIAIQPDGKVVFAARVIGFMGSVINPPVMVGDVVVFRTLVNGTLDVNFANGGTDIVRLGGHSTADIQKFAIAAGPDGQIAVGGGSSFNGTEVPTLIVYDRDGNRDEAVGPQGILRLTSPNGFRDSRGASFHSLAYQADGRLVALAASSDGAYVVRFVGGQAAANSESVLVNDHETLTLTLSRDTFSENAGQFAAFATVTRSNTDNSSPLTVAVSSADSTEFTVPPLVTILANSAFATFPITAVDDALFDGNQSVTLSVSFAGYLSSGRTLTVTDNELPGAITQGNILVTRQAALPGTYELAEFSPTGDFVHAIPIPWGGAGPRPGSEVLRDLIQDQFGSLYFYNGTSTPYLTTVSPPSLVFSSQNFAGWSSSTAGGAGGIATFHQFVYATDSNTASGTAAGIVRFDRTDNSVQRFSNAAGYQDLTVGLNGLLYALNLNQHIDVYDPVTMALLSSVDLPAGDYRGLAVKANGQILAAGADGKIYLFDASGALLTSVASGAALLTDIDIEPGGRVIAGSLAGDVVITDSSLASPTKFAGGPSEVFVAFAIDTSFRTPTIHTAAGPAVVLENNPPTAIDSGLIVTDDGASLVGATLTFSSGYVPDSDHLEFVDQNGITGQFDPVSGVLRLDGAASVANYQAALRSVKYFTSSNAPAASRTVTLIVTDGSFTGTTSRVIQVTPQNDPPRVNPNQVLVVAENDPNSTVVGTVTAVDDDSPTWNGYTIVSGNADGVFAINSNTGVITVANNSLLDYEVSHSYVLGITVTDGSLISPVQTVTILVIDLNDTVPIILANQEFFVPENSAANFFAGDVLALDPDSVGDLQDFAIVSGNASGIWAIEPDSGRLKVVNGSTLDFEGQKTYTLGIRVSDGVHQSAVQNVQITLTDQNDVAPVVVAGTFSITENSANGTSVGMVTATDVDTVGTLQNFAIVSGTGATALQIDAVTGQITVKNSGLLNFEATPVLTLGVIVSDGLRNSAVQTITIQLTDVNESPVLTPKTFSVPELSANGLIVGTITGTDPDAGQSLTYAITSGNAGAAFALNSNTGVLTVLNGALLDFETTSLYNFTVTATDNGNPTLFGSALITVNLTNVNDAPTINAGQSFTIAENSSNGTGIGTVQAHDVDAGSVLTYSITGGNASGAFAINPASGAISVADSSKLDFETIPTFTLTVRVTDNGVPSQFASAPVVIQVSNANEAPVVVPATFTLPENSPKPTLVGTVVANDQDAGQSRLFSIVGGNINNAFSIHFTLGTLTVNNPAALDFETQPTFQLQIRVQDNGNPSLFSTGSITINLTDAGDPPVVNDQTFSISEASQSGAIVGNVIATDPDQVPLVYEIIGGNIDGIFALDSQTGVLSVANPAGLDFENLTSVALQVQVTKPGSPPLSTAATITVNVTDANEVPVLSDATFHVDENSVGGTVVGTLTATDPDLGQSLSYSITGGNTNSAFEINSATGAIRVASGALLNFEALANFVLTVQVSDSGLPTRTATAQVTIDLNDLNEAPDLSNLSVTLAENSANGTVVSTLTANDPDTGQQLSYSITAGNSSGAFSINPSTGQVSIASNASLNFEALSQIVLTVKVVDDGQPGLSDTATLTINLSDVNEPPRLTPQTFTLAENAANGTVVGTIVAVDDDPGQQSSYSITASDLDGLFGINSDGVLTIAKAELLDFETHPVIHLTITATDNGTPVASDSQQFTLQLTNVNEPPRVVLSPGVRTLPSPVKPQALDPQAAIQAGDGPGVSLANTTLQVRVISGAAAADKVRLLKSKSGDVVFKGNNILFQGTVIGERIYGKKGAVPLTVHFNNAATQAGVEGVLRKIYYQTKGAIGSTRTLEFTLSGLPGGQTSRSTKVVQLG